MRNIFAKHEPYWDTGHLGDVVEDMKTQGAPTIRAVEFEGDLYATEGSHRIASAHHLGLIPKIILEESEESSDTQSFWSKVAKTASKICV